MESQPWPGGPSAGSRFAQAQVEGPVEPAAAALQVFEQLTIDCLEIRSALDRLHARLVAQPRGAQAGSPLQVLDQPRSPARTGRSGCARGTTGRCDRSAGGLRRSARRASSCSRDWARDPRGDGSSPQAWSPRRLPRGTPGIPGGRRRRVVRWRSTRFAALDPASPSPRPGGRLRFGRTLPASRSSLCSSGEGRGHRGPDGSSGPPGRRAPGGLGRAAQAPTDRPIVQAVDLALRERQPLLERETPDNSSTSAPVSRETSSASGAASTVSRMAARASP